MNTLAVDIGGTKFTLAIFEDGRMIRREQRKTDQGGGGQWILGQIEAMVAQWRREFRFDRCGIGFGGPVIFSEQRVALSTHVGGWNDVPLTAWLSERADAPAVMDNDANVGALGEFRFGAGRGASPLFYLTLSTGIGGGIVIDGKVLRGPDSWAGEVGHINVVPDGPDCLCGSNGCLERLCCGLWLERDHGAAPQILFRDPDFINRYVVPLARGLKAVIMLLNPERIVIGGGLSKAGDSLFEPLRAELKRQMPPWSQARVAVQPAALGDDSVLWGALALCRMTRRSLLLGLAAAPLSVSEVLASDVLASNGSASAESIASIERRVFDAINFQRVAADREPLRWNAELCLTARQHSRRMLDAHFFGHTDPRDGELTARLNRAHIAWLHCGENIFREKDYQDPVSIAVVHWMYSEGHRHNIVFPEYTETGVGVAIDAAGAVAITQQFIAPVPGAAQPH